MPTKFCSAIPTSIIWLGNSLPKFVNFESHAKSMGANGETVESTSELEAAFKRAKNSDKTYVIVIETHGY